MLVHRAPLLEQWIAQLCTFLDLRPKDVGRIGSGARRANRQLDVAMIQSLSRRGDVDEIVASYGQVIVDECHHVPAVSFERVMREVKARYVLGLTATPHRRDGLQPILQFQLGPVRFAISRKNEAEGRAFERRLVVRETAFRLAQASPITAIQDVYRELAKDESRNRLILSDVVASLREGRSPIVLTERRVHLEFLDRELGGAAPNRVVLRSGMTTKARREAMERLAAFPAGEPRLVLATGRFLGEGRRRPARYALPRASRVLSGDPRPVRRPAPPTFSREDGGPHRGLCGPSRPDARPHVRETDAGLQGDRVRFRRGCAFAPMELV